MRIHWEALSIVIVDREGHLASVQKSILRGVGVRRYTMVENIAELQKDLILGRDIVIINWTSAGDGFADMIRSVRHKDTSPDPFVPIIVMSPAAKWRLALALEAGATSFLRFPFSGADFLRHVAHAVTSPRRFVDITDYFGPDRRRRADPLYGGPERRSVDVALLEGENLAAERARMRATAMSALEIKVSIAT